MAQGDGASVIPLGMRSPAAGYVVAPGHMAELLVQFRAARKGAWRYDYADVRYSSGGRQFTLRLPNALGVCAPPQHPCQITLPPAGGTGR